MPPTLQTDRLLLAALTMQTVRLRLRLQGPGFGTVLPLPDGPQRVIFPPEWPGDALGFFPLLTDASVGHHFVLIRRDDRVAIGAVGQKGGPDARGDLEIGYGLNPDAWNQGYATEALRTLLPYWQARPGVRRVTAQTAVGNGASARVLQKCGFVRTGEGWDEDEGPLLRWATSG